MFWRHHDLLLSCDREDLLKTIEQIIENSLPGQSITTSYPTPITAARNAIVLGRLADQVPDAYAMIYIHSYEETDQQNLSSGQERALRLRIRHDKKGEREFVQEILPSVDAFCARQFAVQQSEPQLAILHSSSTVDVAIGVTVMLLARYFGAEGDLMDNGGTTSKSNAVVPRSLALIVNSILERVDPSPFRMDPEKYTQRKPFSCRNEASERVSYVAKANHMSAVHCSWEILYRNSLYCHGIDRNPVYECMLVFCGLCILECRIATHLV